MPRTGLPGGTRELTILTENNLKRRGSRSLDPTGPARVRTQHPACPIIIRNGAS